jgi:hypothetical protein
MAVPCRRGRIYRSADRAARADDPDISAIAPRRDSRASDHERLREIPEDNPEMADKPYGAAIAETLKKAFPCSGQGT